MTTQIIVDVNGRYVATVTQINADGVEQTPVEVHGRYEGSPNPSGQRSFHAYHPANVTFKVDERYLGDKDA